MIIIEQSKLVRCNYFERNINLNGYDRRPAAAKRLKFRSGVYYGYVTASMLTNYVAVTIVCGNCGKHQQTEV
jgi:hypothetical protein